MLQIEQLPPDLLSGGVAGFVAAVTWKALQIWERKAGKGSEQLGQLVQLQTQTNSRLEKLAAAIGTGLEELKRHIDGKL